MIVRRFLAGVVLAGLAVPALAAAPHAREPKPVPDAFMVAMGGRVFARAESGSEFLAQAAPTPSTAPSPVSTPPVTSPAPGAVPAAGTAPAASPTPASLGAAQLEFLAFQTGKIDRTHYDAAANAELTDSKVTQASAGLKPLGEFKDITQLERAERQGLTIYLYRVRAQTGAVQMILAVDKDGKYAGVLFRPDQK
jgi:hypothetical protein